MIWAPNIKSLMVSFLKVMSITFGKISKIKEEYGEGQLLKIISKRIFLGRSLLTSMNFLKEKIKNGLGPDKFSCGEG